MILSTWSTDCVSLGLATEWIEIGLLLFHLIVPSSLGLATEWIEMILAGDFVKNTASLGLATEWIEICSNLLLYSINTSSRSCDRVD